MKTNLGKGNDNDNMIMATGDGGRDMAPHGTIGARIFLPFNFDDISFIYIKTVTFIERK